MTKTRSRRKTKRSKGRLWATEKKLRRPLLFGGRLFNRQKQNPAANGRPRLHMVAKEQFSRPCNQAKATKPEKIFLNWGFNAQESKTSHNFKRQTTGNTRTGLLFGSAPGKKIKTIFFQYSARFPLKPTGANITYS